MQGAFGSDRGGPGKRKEYAEILGLKFAYAGTVRIMVAGVLLCTGEPGQWMPHAQIQAVSYAGERQDINYQSDARDQDLTSQIDV